MKTMGCKIVPDRFTNVALKTFVDRLGLIGVLEVPIRMRGLTSSGTPHKCYYNVRNLVEVFGGESVTGWCVSESVERRFVDKKNYVDTITTYLVGHSMWLNDREHLSDVTTKRWMPSAMAQGVRIDKLVDRDGDKLFIPFIPWKRLGVDTDEHMDLIRNLLIKTETSSTRDAAGKTSSQLAITHPWHTTFIERIVPWDNLSRTYAEKHFVNRNETKTFKKQFGTDYPKMTGDIMRREGQFVENSVSSGKGLTELREIKKRQKKNEKALKGT